MKADSPRISLKCEFRRLFRAMDFISNRYLARTRVPAKRAASFYDVYQQLGIAWEHLALQCRHWDGDRKVRGGKFACRICGKIKGANERWLLLPVHGQKVNRSKMLSEMSVGRRSSSFCTVLGRMTS